MTRGRGRRSPKHREIVINDSHGGFGLSEAAVRLMISKGGQGVDELSRLSPLSMDFYIGHVLPRDNPALVSAVKKLGKDANAPYSRLKIVKIPRDVKWEIAEENGSEWVAEKHRTWF